jgi:hypothetical protein
LATLTDGEVVSRLRALAAEIEGRGAPETVPAIIAPPEPPKPATRLAWGAKVSSTFRDRIAWLCADLDIGPEPGKPEPSWMMTCIAWESGRTFSPKVKNMAGSGATGLIQFMPTTAQKLGTSTAALAKMTAEDQINYVWRYFKPWKGRLRSLADVYLAILWPLGVGKPEGFVLWDKDSRPTTYRQNAGLDVNRDGEITKAEAASKVAALLPEGMQPGNAA